MYRSSRSDVVRPIYVNNFVASNYLSTAKLQSEMNHLYDDLDQQKQSRTELSDEILRDARARLQMVQQQVCGLTSIP